MSFSKDISKFGAKAVQGIQEIRAQTTIALFNAVIRDTPVDTGRARANWQVTAGAPAAGSMLTMSQSKTTIEPNEQALIVATNGDTPVFLTNNLVYAWKLEYGGYTGGNDLPMSDPAATKSNSAGFSKQAPAGMVRKNIARLDSIVRSVVRKIRT